MQRLSTLIAAVGIAVSAVVPTGAAPASGPSVPATVGSITCQIPDGVAGRWDSSYENGGDGDGPLVFFDSAVWESGSDDTGWRVDLHLTVMRGQHLVSARALHDWFIDYQQRPANEVTYRKTRISGHDGWRTADQVFWLVEPGLAVSVTMDRTRWGAKDLMSTARSCR